MRSFELGFYVAPAPETLPARLDALAEQEIGYFGTDGFGQWRDDTYVERVSRIIAASGMRQHSFHAPFGLMFPRREDLDQSLADNRRIIDVAAHWGTRSIVWHTRWFRGSTGDSHFADCAIMDAMQPAAIDALMSEVLPATCAYAQERNIFINLENLPLFHWGRDCNDLLDFIRKQSLPALGFIYDIGHAWCSGFDPAEPIRLARDLLRDTHFHDNLGVRQYDLARTASINDVPFYDHHLPVGLGTINWIEVVRALREIDYQYPVIFEGPTLKGHPEAKSLEQFKRSVRITISNWHAFEDMQPGISELLAIAR